MHNQDVPRRANHVLHLILISFLLILLRVYYLSVVKHEVYQEKARLPQIKTVIEPSARGTIRDRFNIPLAINNVQYDAAICYDRIRDIPLVTFEKNAEGKKTKVYKRRRYIEKLSSFLAKELELSATEVEDLIYSHASIFPHIPYVIKEGLLEETYCRLRALQKDWPGLVMKREAKRSYPQGKLGGNLIGYMGAIDQAQYFKIADEIENLQSYLDEREAGGLAILPKGFESTKQVKERLSELREKAYTLHTRMGKTGIERKFDESLRGFYGKNQREVESKGRLIRELPGKREALSGERIVLTLSSELQAFAESLLIQNEKERQRHFPLAGKHHDRILPPWILGGAIVAMLPDTGEVVAMASYPRFDPNDFTSQNNAKIHQWLETPRHLSRIWEGKAPLKRECFSYGSEGFYEEEKQLTWDLYLDSALSLSGKVRQAMRRISTLSEAHHLLQLREALQKICQNAPLHTIFDLLYSEVAGHRPSHLTSSVERKQEAHAYLTGEQEEVVTLIQKDLDPYLSEIKINDDKLLFFDLLSLLIDEALFSDELIKAVKDDTLSSYFTLCQAYANIEETIKKQVKVVFHERLFPLWREKNFKTFLNEKREIEKEKKTYQHPYTEYLKEAETELFEAFWTKNRLSFFHAFLFESVSDENELKAFSFHLLLKKRELKKSDQVVYNHLMKLTERFQTLSPALARAYLSTLRSYGDLTKPLLSHHYSFSKPHDQQTLQDLARAFYPKYGFGFTKSYAYGSFTTIGSLFKVVTGYEALKQHYMEREEKGLPLYDLNPLTIYDEVSTHLVTDQGMVLGRTLDGKFITRQYKGGRLPKSHVSIGKVDFLKAMERSSNIYFSLLAGDQIDHPSSLYKTTCDLGFGKPTGIDLPGEVGGYVPDDILDQRTSLYAFAIGQHELIVTPLQTAVMFSFLANGGEVLKPQIVKRKAGVSALKKQSEIFSDSSDSYKSYYASIGIHFPFFTETLKLREEPTTLPFSKQVKETLLLPSPVRSKLLESLHCVVWGEKGPAQPYRIRGLMNRPKWIRDYKSLKDQLIGKTSTAEFMYRPTLDKEMPPLLCTDIWFGSMSFKKTEEEGFDPEKGEPELVVIVYLRYGDYGKEAAPLAAQMVKKWRELQTAHE